MAKTLHRDRESEVEHIVEQRLRRMIEDMKTVHETLEQGGWDDPRLQGDLRAEALEEFRLMLNKVRRLLWSCYLARNEKADNESKPLDIYLSYELIDRLRAHRKPVDNNVNASEIRI